MSLFIKKTFIFQLTILITLVIPLSQSAANPARASINAHNTLSALDDFFMNQYERNSLYLGQVTRPVLVVNGFSYQLFFPDDTVDKFLALKSPFNALKAISHIGPNLYSIARRAEINRENKNWQKLLTQYQKTVQTALKQVDDIDWSNPAWPGKADELAALMKYSLDLTDQFIADTLLQEHFTLNDYQRFADDYLHTMTVTMYLADLANTTATLDKLQQWQHDLGDEWDNLYVIVMGSKGRSTAGLTINTNTAAYTVASLMSPEQAKEKIIIIPEAKNIPDGFNALGSVINSRQLAQATFTSSQAREITGMDQALENQTIPLAMDNVKNIIRQSVHHNKITIPDLTYPQ